MAKLLPSLHYPLIHIVSNTAELLQQIEQLNTVKQELTTEVIGFSFLFGDGFRVNCVVTSDR